jgi:hypothetical protein
MNNFEDDNYLNRMYDELNTAYNTLLNELKNDKECTKEKSLNMKMACIDTMRKQILKYRNIRIKDKLKGDL